MSDIYRDLPAQPESEPEMSEEEIIASAQTDIAAAKNHNDENVAVFDTMAERLPDSDIKHLKLIAVMALEAAHVPHEMLMTMYGELMLRYRQEHAGE